MEKRLLNFALFVALSCSAQLPVVPVTLISASNTQTNPTFIPGLAFWWVSSDLTNGITVSNWIDRVQGRFWTNGNTSTRPTNSATGIYFSGSTTLSNDFVSFTAASNFNKIWILGKFIKNNPASGADNWITSEISQGIGVGALNILDVASQTPYYKCITNVFVDTLIAGTGNVISSLITTNNVSTGKTLNWVTSGTHKFSDFASTAQANTRGTFYVTEVAIFTNDVTSTQAVWLHTYATNTYAYSP